MLVFFKKIKFILLSSVVKFCFSVVEVVGVVAVVVAVVVEVVVEVVVAVVGAVVDAVVVVLGGVVVVLEDVVEAVVNLVCVVLVVAKAKKLRNNVKSMYKKQKLKLVH